MKKLYPYLAAIPILAFALFPPIEIRIPLSDSTAISWLFLIAGALGICTSYFRINLLVKLAIFYIFISCFFSSAPYLSFLSYIPIVALAYFYVLCTKIENMKPIIHALQVVILINLILLIMQHVGREYSRDYICNPGLREIVCWGSIGNPMRLKSLLIVSSGVLVALTKPKKIFVIAGTILFLFVAGYFTKKDVIQDFLYARGPVWLKTLELYYSRHPYFGNGIGMFKIIFPAFAQGGFVREGAWMTAHNCWLQILFEIGAIGFSLISAFFAYLFVKLIKIDLYLLFGLLVIGLDMMVHFPTRQVQCIFIIVMFIAHCDRKIKERINA